MKKNKIWVLLFFIFLIWGRLNAQGIDFLKIQDVSFEQVLAKASTENKLIFMDVYTTWCGPCKVMDKTTFSDSQVGDKFNKEYICFKVNGEDLEGRKLVQKYRINAYPSFLFIDSKGTAINRLEGVFPPKNLIEEADYTQKIWKESE